MIGIAVVPQQLTIPKALQAFDAEGALQRPADRAGLEALVDQLTSALAVSGVAA